MHEARLAKAIAETGAIIKTQGTGEGIYVYSCDTVPHTAKQVYHRNQIALVGGGGTDLGPGIRAASLRQPRPDAMVVITDGDTPWPEQGPLGIRVIVVLVGRTNTIPKWVHATIAVPMDD
jgi:predicted metal-dependent peptidase